MHTQSVAPWVQDHSFLGEHHEHRERRTWIVVAFTAVMMVAEIGGGSIFGSMALIADGWHMATHVAALAIAGLAYLLARRHANDPRFSFGTGKFGDLAAFASATILGMIALGIGYDSILRLVDPVVIHFREAIPIAALGLGVNLVSAWLLHDGHGHGHAHAHSHSHSGEERRDHDHHHHPDTNWRAAYVHVVVDALTSVLAIGGLLAAWAFGWTWIDPVVGLVGMVVIVSWTVSLIRAAGCVLLDTVPDRGLADRIRERMEIGGDRVADLHVWRVGPGHAAVIASVVSEAPQAPSEYKRRLSGLQGLSHVTVEVHACSD
jgi:cation diffusion facilitator family transporter